MQALGQTKMTIREMKIAGNVDAPSEPPLIVDDPERKEFTGDGYRFYWHSSMEMSECADNSVALTVTSPQYWNAIDYDVHANSHHDAWHRERNYTAFGESLDDYLTNVGKVFKEVYRVTADGGFCVIVVGTVLHKGKHYPIPMLITQKMGDLGWEFHQDIIWNKVTGGVKRAGSFIQHPQSGYYYPNIMTEYILVFRKPGKPRRGQTKALEIDDLFKRDIANNIWHIAPVPPRTIDHPCPYPEELARRLILLYSDVGDEVLDPFLGSAQTAIAALRQNRRCVGYDVEQSYLHLSERRVLSPPPQRQNNLIANFERVLA